MMSEEIFIKYVHRIQLLAKQIEMLLQPIYE